MTSTTRRPSRRLAVSFVLALLGAVAPAVRAEEVQTSLTGEVLTVSIAGGAPAGTQADLAALGVVAGASATVTWRVESTTPPEAEEGILPYTFYRQGITHMVLQIGSYSTELFLPVGFEDLNVVQVGDNVPGPSVSDSYLMSTPATESARLLHGAAPGWPTMSVSLFDFTGANASTDDGIVQDATKYQLGNAVIGGVNGSINVVLDVGKGGGGKGVGPEFCAKKQLLAAKVYGRKALLCLAKSAQQPTKKDPLGDKLDACLDKAAAQFELKIGKAIFKATKKGGSCAVTDPITLGTELRDALAQVAEDVGTGVDPDDTPDRALRAKILRAAGAQWTRDVAAYAKDVMKPSPAKLAKKLDASRAVVEKQIQRAVDKAQKKGILYGGPDAETLADTIRTLAEEVATAAGG